MTLAVVDQGIISHREGRGAFMPVITPLEDGSWIASQHVGTGLATPDNRIEVLLSTDEGVSWAHHADLPAPGIEEEDYNYRGPKISTVPDGRLVMAAGRFQQTEGEMFNLESEGLQRPEMLLLWSEDLGKTWSEPQVVPVDLPPERYTWNGAGSLQQLGADRWMYPLETWKPEGYEGPPDQKAMAVFSADQGQTWGELTVVADDQSGRLLYWDQMCATLTDGRIYTLIWTHLYGTSDDLNNHWTISEDEGRSWTAPRPTNLRGQVCTPIPLADGRVAAIYNHRHDPHGIRVALTEDLEQFDLASEVVVFDAGREATLGPPKTDNFLAEHLQIAFGKPGGLQLPDGDLITYFWCTAAGVTHTRWVRLRLN